MEKLSKSLLSFTFNTQAKIHCLHLNWSLIIDVAESEGGDLIADPIPSLYNTWNGGQSMLNTL